MADPVAGILAWAKAKVEGITGSGRVYDYPRESRDDDVVEDFGTSEQVEGYEQERGWVIELKNRVPDRGGRHVHALLLTGSWVSEENGANRIDFTEHVYAVADAFTADKTPAVAGVQSAGPATVTDMSSDETIFGRFGHVATIEVPVRTPASLSF